ncbi:hypothetical protein GB937_000353 [Aspergillus fischeri]|nr:hypothetical protein GB937_000353 [Aspergillus fischeri]
MPSDAFLLQRRGEVAIEACAHCAKNGGVFPSCVAAPEVGGLRAVDCGDPVRDWPLDDTAPSVIISSPVATEVASSAPATGTRRQTRSDRAREVDKASTPASSTRRRFNKASSVASDPFVSNAETPRRPPSFDVDKGKGATKRLLFSTSGSPSSKRRRRNPLDGAVLSWPISITDFEDVDRLRLASSSSRSILRLYSLTISSSLPWKWRR